MTINQPVVMGRKTFASLKRALPGRTNIVITRDPQFQAAGAVVTTSFETARVLAQADASRRGAADIAVLGGAEIYAQFFGIADRLEITEVHATPEGDTHFPAITTRMRGRKSRGSGTRPVPDQTLWPSPM